MPESAPSPPRQVQAYEEFLALASHELRSPLNAITGWTHVLEHAVAANDAAALARAVDGIKRSAAQQARLVADLMDASDLLAGRLRIYPSRVALDRALATALEGVRAAAEAKHVTIEVGAARGDAAVLADPDRLQQMLANLLGNAVKIAPNESRIAVNVDVTDAAGVAIEVADQSRGLSSERLERALAGAQGSGMGVALSLARRLAQLHGGDLTARAAGDRPGATLRLLLPAAPADAGPAGDAGKATLAGVRVMVLAEAELGTRESTARTLADAGAEVRALRGAGEVLDALATLPVAQWPQMLVCEIGAQAPREPFLRKLRVLEDRRGVARDARARAIAIVASDRAEDQTRLVVSGFETVLAKPVTGASLVAAVAGLAGIAASARVNDT